MKNPRQDNSEPKSRIEIAWRKMVMRTCNYPSEQLLEFLEQMERHACGKNFVEWIFFAGDALRPVRLERKSHGRWREKLCGEAMPWFGQRQIGLCDECKRDWLPEDE